MRRILPRPSATAARPRPGARAWPGQNLHDRITQLDDVTRAMFLSTKAMDTSRPVIDASGYSHRALETDIYDSHSYEQGPAAFRRHVSGLTKGALGDVQALPADLTTKR